MHVTGLTGVSLVHSRAPPTRSLNHPAIAHKRSLGAPGAGGGAGPAHGTAVKRANSFAPPTTTSATKIAQYASRNNTLRHLRRACSCSRRSGFISRRLGMERAYSESHPAASGVARAGRVSSTAQRPGWPPRRALSLLSHFLRTSAARWRGLDTVPILKT